MTQALPNLFVPGDREFLARRLSELEPTAQRRWGTMTPAQMLRHCAVGLEAATGDRPMRQVFLGRLLAPLMLRGALGPKPIAKGIPTDPAFRIVGELDFEAERTRLATLLDRFIRRGPEGAEGATHAFFGRMEGRAWGRLMYKHLDHHLTQFGV